MTRAARLGTQVAALLVACLVVLGGSCDVEGNQGSWKNVGRRANVFAGLPYALYLPPGSRVLNLKLMLLP